MKTINPLLKTDSYKLGHIQQYPKGTTGVYSNYTNRGSRIEGVNHAVFFGLQRYLKDLQDSFDIFFATPLQEVLDDYRRKTSTFVAPGNFDISHVEALHKLQYLPLKFNAVLEGTLVPMRVPSLTVENTHPDFFWLVNYIETDLSAAIWHPSTSATTAWVNRRIFDKAAEKTSSTPEAVDFQGHDFSYRGMENWQAASASGAGHLLSFVGTDCVPTIDFVEHYYPGDNGLVAASVPATEHSVMCAGGMETESETYNRLLDIYPEGILSVVSDTWDFWKVLTEILPSLKDKIMARDGKLVIRPDSGNPADIICGTAPITKEVSGVSEQYKKNLINEYPELSTEFTSEQKGAIQILWEIFGGTINDKGYKELDSHIGLIYGDGMSRERITEINERLESKGFASTNWVAGFGSYAYQYVTRDTLGSAVKATWAEIDGEGHNLQKDPATDDGLKKSATGRLAVLTEEDGSLFLIQKATPQQEAQSVLEPVWENGKFLREQSFAQVRATLKDNTELLVRNGSID